MNTRIFSFQAIVIASIALASTQTARAQDRPGYYTDPSTGIVYRQVTRTVERPVVDTKIEKQEQTVFRPQTVKETRPETQTVFTPVTEYELHSYVEGRWNPFRQPTVAYRSIPKTRWEARNHTINRTATRTEWVSEKRTVDVPHRIVRMEREQKVDYEVVGRVAPPRAEPNTTTAAIAARLRPLNSGAAVQPMASPAPYPPTVPRLASSSVGRMTSDPPRRSVSQSGMRGTNLYPRAPNGYGSVLPPVGGGSGMAILPGFSLWR